MNLKGWVPTIVLVLAILPFVITLAPFLIGGNHALVVLSGSMEPTMKPGDIVVTRQVDPVTLQEGDVITFRQGRTFVTHRIEERVESQELVFRMKGDANEDPDRAVVRPNQVVGRVMLVIPYYGYAINYLGKGMIPLVLIVVPSLLIVVNELRTIWKGLGEETTEKHSQKGT